jgi:hypothetical protein
MQQKGHNAAVCVGFDEWVAGLRHGFAPLFYSLDDRRRGINIPYGIPHGWASRA